MGIEREHGLWVAIAMGLAGLVACRGKGESPPEPPARHAVGGTLTGLASSRSVTLRNNGGDDLTVSANGPFAFTTRLVTGAAYAVTVQTPPAGQTCTVTGGSGMRMPPVAFCRC